MRIFSELLLTCWYIFRELLGIKVIKHLKVWQVWLVFAHEHHVVTHRRRVTSEGGHKLDFREPAKGYK